MRGGVRLRGASPRGSAPASSAVPVWCTAGTWLREWPRTANPRVAPRTELPSAATWQHCWICLLTDQGRGCAAPGRPPPVRLTAGTPALRRFAPRAPPPLTSRARPAWTESSSWQTIIRTSPEPPTRRRSIRPTPGCIKGADASLRDDLRPPLTRPLHRALVLRYGFGGSLWTKNAWTGKHAHADERMHRSHSPVASRSTDTWPAGGAFHQPRRPRRRPILRCVVT